ncbi:MAG: hypothetical protein DMG64_03220 [Acidobacteria bacterium]|nr:MAG: hypothetical protein DMG63_08780 [Acidobacteriota bacterium]PYY05350.1 MAG: hypothetical protein DMG64_03220 [Acidobacteriota bacterium]
MNTEMVMPPKGNPKPWNTPDFEVRFREAMGRSMTPQEREFFGLKEEDDGDQVSSNEASDRAQFAWQALRRISALLG